MIELFNMGGPLFMSAITLAFFAALVFAVKTYLAIASGKPQETIEAGIKQVKALGLLSLVLGVLGQLIGLYSAFVAIEKMGTVSQSMLAGGLKVSSITTIWGLICYVMVLLITIWLTAGKTSKS